MSRGCCVGTCRSRNPWSYSTSLVVEALYRACTHPNPRGGANPDFLVSLAGRCSFWKAPPAGAPAPMMPSLLRKSWDVGAVFPRPKLPHIWPMRPPPLLPPPSKAPIDEARGLRRVGFIIAGSIVESHEPGGRRDTPEAEDVADSQLLSHRPVRNTG